jgi:AcrR family transcriptional regulator
VVATAIHLADTEGFDAVTMRRVASELGLGTMSLYWYVESRDDLLDLMFDEIMGEQLLPEPIPTDWREALVAIAHATKAAHERHPWLGTSIGERSGISPNMMRHAEQSLAAVSELELDPVASMQVLGAVDDYVVGHITRSMARLAMEDKIGPTEEDWERVVGPWLRQLLAGGGFPHLTKMDEHPDGYAAMVADTFEAGLQFVLDGIERNVGRDTGRASAAPDDTKSKKKKAKGKA